MRKCAEIAINNGPASTPRRPEPRLTMPDKLANCPIRLYDPSAGPSRTPRRPTFCRPRTPSPVHPGPRSSLILCQYSQSALRPAGGGTVQPRHEEGTARLGYEGRAQFASTASNQASNSITSQPTPKAGHGAVHHGDNATRGLQHVERTRWEALGEVTQEPWTGATALDQDLFRASSLRGRRRRRHRRRRSRPSSRAGCRAIADHWRREPDIAHPMSALGRDIVGPVELIPFRHDGAV